MTEGTELYRQAMAFDYGDRHAAEIMREVWTPTPFVVDIFTGRTGEDRSAEIGQWYRAHFGAEAWPIHGRPGSWQRGCATVNGWTWYGFATEAQLNEFLAAWPQPVQPCT